MCHGAADNEQVHMLDEVFKQGEFGGNFCTANNSCQWFIGIVKVFSKLASFLLKQATSGMGE